MKYITTAAIALLIATSANAQENVQRAKAKIWDEYRTVTESTPTTTYQCYDEEVPIYGRTGNGASGADVLGGLILGGILGKGISGNDKGAAAGAVLGGVIAADKGQGGQKIIGYRREQVCKNVTEYQTVRKEVYAHSIIMFNHNGVQRTLRFQK